MKNLTDIVQSHYRGKFGVVNAFPRLTDEEVTKFEAQLGRKLTPTEVLMGSLTRKPTLPVFGTDKFRVRMANEASADPFDKEVEEARKAVRDEELRAYPDDRTMVANLAADHETIIRRLHEDIKNNGDMDVAAVLTTLLHQHQKMAWMLHKFLED